MEPTQRNPELRRKQIEHDLPYLHRERWNRIAAELGEQIEAATGEEREHLKQRLDRHYADRFHPETSLAALLAEAGADGADDHGR